MATFSQLAQIAASSDFQQRVSYAMTVAAVAVYNEGSNVTNHTIRAAYAVNVTKGSYNLAGACLMVLTNSTIATEADITTVGNSIPDSDIQFSVNSIWGVLSGA